MLLWFLIQGTEYTNKCKTSDWIFIAKSSRLRWRTEEAYFKGEVWSAEPKLHRGFLETEFKKEFFRGVDPYSGLCLRLAPIVRLASDSENDR